MVEVATVHRVKRELARRGFIHLPAPQLQELARWPERDWPAFAASWDNLGMDRFMADGGRYRRRRHAVFEASGERIVRLPHQPHFQSRDYNPLNGDVQRWFDPLDTEVADGSVLGSLFALLTPLFSALDRHQGHRPWYSEVHQFRIETSNEELGRPTPEGLHRDGVDWVLVLLVARENVEEGTTEIGSPRNRPFGRFTLSEPGDAVLLDDRRIRHGVTPIRPIDPKKRAFRDALVVTWTSPGTLR